MSNQNTAPKTPVTVKEDEYLRVLNFLVWLDVAINSGDMCRNISFFNCNETKHLMNRLEKVILRDHSKTLSKIWNLEQSEMPNYMEKVYKLTEVVSRVPLHRIEEATEVLNQYFPNEEDI